MVKLGTEGIQDHMIEGYSKKNCPAIQGLTEKETNSKFAKKMMKEFQKDLAVGMYRENFGSFSEAKEVY